MQNGEMTGETLWQLFERAAKRHPCRPALMLPRETLTFAALHDEAMMLAAEMRQRKPGAIAISYKNKAASLAAFFGSMSARRPAALLDADLGDLQIKQQLENLRPAYLLPGITSDVTFSPRETKEDEFYWGLTSGTTGAPKAFVRTHASWLASFAAAEEVFPFAKNEVIAIPGALSNSLFLYGAVHALCRGLTVAAVSGFSTNGALRHFKSTGATVLYAVPAMLQEFAKAGFRDFNPRMIFCGGAKLKDELRREIERQLPHTNLIEFYGASELSFVSFASTSYPAPQGSVGRVFPGVQIRVVYEGSEAVPAGKQGLIAVRSPMVFSRYLNDAPTEAYMVQGWHTAGDVGRIDDSGFLYVEGRCNRVINTSGRKISPEVIEGWLESLPSVRGAAVVGVPDARRGHRISAVLEMSYAAPDRGDLVRQCRKTLGPQFVPHDFFIIHALPRTQSGKIAVAEVSTMVQRRDPALMDLGDGAS